MNQVKRAFQRPILLSLLSLLFLAFQSFPASLMSQVRPEVVRPANFSAFGEYTYGHSNYGKEAIYGFTLGGFVQTSHIVGFAVRGSALRYGGLDHQYSALAGVRAEHTFARFSPYFAALGGAGHARWQVGGRYDPALQHSDIAPEWNVIGGVDLHLRDHFSIRLGEISYSKIYVLQHGLTPLSFSTGIVYRLPF